MDRIISRLLESTENFLTVPLVEGIEMQSFVEAFDKLWYVGVILFMLSEDM